MGQRSSRVFGLSKEDHLLYSPKLLDLEHGTIRHRDKELAEKEPESIRTGYFYHAQLSDWTDDSSIREFQKKLVVQGSKREGNKLFYVYAKGTDAKVEDHGIVKEKPKPQGLGYRWRGDSEHCYYRLRFSKRREDEESDSETEEKQGYDTIHRVHPKPEMTAFSLSEILSLKTLVPAVRIHIVYKTATLESDAVLSDLFVHYSQSKLELRVITDVEIVRQNYDAREMAEREAERLAQEREKAGEGAVSLNETLAQEPEKGALHLDEGDNGELDGVVSGEQVEGEVGGVIVNRGAVIRDEGLIGSAHEGSLKSGSAQGSLRITSGKGSLKSVSLPGSVSDEMIQEPLTAGETGGSRDNSSHIEVSTEVSSHTDSDGGAVAAQSGIELENDISIDPHQEEEVENSEAVAVEKSEAVAVENSEAVAVENSEAVAVENSEVIENSEAVAVENSEVIENSEAVAVENSEAVAVENSEVIENSEAEAVENSEAVAGESVETSSSEAISAGSNSEKSEAQSDETMRDKTKASPEVDVEKPHEAEVKPPQEIKVDSSWSEELEAPQEFEAELVESKKKKRHDRGKKAAAVG